METAIGVFSSRDHAETAMKELRQRAVPEESIVFLTRSESEAKTIAKQFGAYVGGFVGGTAGMTTGVVAASLLLPGVGPVFALGFGAAALLGVAGAGAFFLLLDQPEVYGLPPDPVDPIEHIGSTWKGAGAAALALAAGLAAAALGGRR